MTSALKAYAVRLLPQAAALAVILVMVSIAFPGFFRLEMQNGRLYGSLIDILNRGAPVALLAIGMTVVIATKGIDLSVGAVMAICGAVAAACITSGYGLVGTLLVTLGTGILCGLWNGVLVVKVQTLPANVVVIAADTGRTRHPVAPPASDVTCTVTAPENEKLVQDVSCSRLVSVLRASAL